MCGIALLVSGIRLNLSSLPVDSISRKLPELFSPQDFPFSLDDLKSALRRRGPDSLGEKKLLLLSTTAEKVSDIVSFVLDDEEGPLGGKQHTNDIATQTCFSELLFVGATLQLRGLTPISQPLVDSFGNILVYNGEIFGGIQVGRDINDAEILMQYLGKGCSCHPHRQGQTCNLDEEERSCIPDVLSSIKGPWALIYWQSSSNTLWFGRDAFGRRSLLVHWPTMEDNRFLLSSVSASSPSTKSCDLESDNGNGGIKFWEELSCGIYSMSVNAATFPGHIRGEVKKHEWTSGLLRELIEWKRISVVPKPEDVDSSHSKFVKDQNETGFRSPDSVSESARAVLMALQESIMRRTSLYTIFQGISCDSNIMEPVPVAVLFSGGLDSMILAALLDRCVNPKYEIDLLNVSFDGELAPDRISANAGVKELKRVAPFRRWRLVYINAELSKLMMEMKHVLSLIDPANTYMDLNIGTALWLAARGEGWVHKTDSGDNEYVKYKSGARILLVGSGADEQCAGYGRHRTKYRNDSWLGLHEEMRLDMQRIWKRNLGRDDRCIADNGKEARFPFLDEDVIRTLLKIPLWEVADLGQPSGRGDKKILREVAHLLGLHEAAVLPKRAIQFGSRIARESNRKNFGSNRAANQASAGSAVIHMPCSQSHT